MVPTSVSKAALDSFEGQITKRLSHPAFNQFGKVSVTKKEARGWGEAWALDKVTAAEKHAMAAILIGTDAPLSRKKGCPAQETQTCLASGRLCQEAHLSSSRVLNWRARLTRGDDFRC
jgi:hypothetical protein